MEFYSYHIYTFHSLSFISSRIFLFFSRFKNCFRFSVFKAAFVSFPHFSRPCLSFRVSLKNFLVIFLNPLEPSPPFPSIFFMSLSLFSYHFRVFSLIPIAVFFLYLFPCQLKHFFYAYSWAIFVPFSWLFLYHFTVVLYFLFSCHFYIFCIPISVLFLIFDIHVFLQFSFALFQTYNRIVSIPLFESLSYLIVCFSLRIIVPRPTSFIPIFASLCYLSHFRTFSYFLRILLQQMVPFNWPGRLSALRIPIFWPSSVSNFNLRFCNWQCYDFTVSLLCA